MHYGLFVKHGRTYIRIDATTGYTEETAKKVFRPLIQALEATGVKPILRKLPPVKQIDVAAKDKQYARTPW